MAQLHFYHEVNALSTSCMSPQSPLDVKKHSKPDLYQAIIEPGLLLSAELVWE